MNINDLTQINDRFYIYSSEIVNASINIVPCQFRSYDDSLKTDFVYVLNCFVNSDRLMRLDPYQSCESTFDSMSEALSQIEYFEAKTVERLNIE